MEKEIQELKKKLDTVFSAARGYFAQQNVNDEVSMIQCINLKAELYEKLDSLEKTKEKSK